MKERIALIAATSLIAACSLLGPKEPTAEAILSDAQIACALANAAFDDDAIRRICNVAEASLPILKTILADHRAAMQARKECKP